MFLEHPPPLCASFRCGPNCIAQVTHASYHTTVKSMDETIWGSDIFASDPTCAKLG